MQQNSQGRGSEAAQSAHFAGGLLVALLLLYLHPYYGIRHDAVLYLGQALLRQMPEQLAGDLFFVFGSQAQFTLFPYLLGKALGGATAGSLFLVLTLAGLVAFALASYWLICRLWPVGERFWPLLALVLLPSGYGGYGIFSYAEPFLTGRTYAEPLVLVALAMWLTNRQALAAIAWLVAAVIHPLQALPALLVVWLDMVRRDRRWLNVLWLGALPLIAHLAGIRLPESLWQRYDPEWLQWVLEHNRQVLLLQWEPADWAYLAADVFLVSMVARWATAGALQRLARLLLLGTVVGFSISLLVADGLHWVLGTGMQFWRIQWLLHWLAMASAPWLLLECWRRDGAMSPRFAMLVAIIAAGAHVATSWHSGWFSSFAPSFGPSPLAVLVLIPLFLAWPALKGRIDQRYVRLVLVAIALFLVLALIRGIYAILVTSDLVGNSRYAMRIEFLVLSLPLVSGPLVAASIVMWRRRVHLRALFLLVLLVMTAFAGSQWDRRTVWTREIEVGATEQRVFGVDMETGATVYWKDDLIAPWLVLRRASFFAQQQMSGLLFNRKTAEVGYARHKALMPIEVQTELCRLWGGLNSSECTVDEEAIRSACVDANGTLDYLVLDGMPGPSAVGKWAVQGRGLHGDKVINYYLYSCKTLLGDASNAAKGDFRDSRTQAK